MFSPTGKITEQKLWFAFSLAVKFENIQMKKCHETG